MKHFTQNLRITASAAIFALSTLAASASAEDRCVEAVQTPEIDPAFVGGALVLLFGGLLILTDRVRENRALEN